MYLTEVLLFISCCVAHFNVHNSNQHKKTFCFSKDCKEKSKIGLCSPHGDRRPIWPRICSHTGENRMIMKRVILATMVFLGMSAAASAQTATGKASRTTSTASSSTKAKAKKAVKPSDTLNNRRIYHFKNGQRATPTGHEATPSSIGGGYAALGRNTKSPAPPKKQEQKTASKSKRSN